MTIYSALLYWQAASFRNRLVTRLKRLKQPKYLIGGIVGGLYFYFYFVRFLFQGHGRGGQSANPISAFSADDLFLVQSGGALLLAVILLLAWVIPRSRAALAFTEAEVAFLFTAPVSRRQLIHYKLLRSQAGILFTVLLLTLVTNRFGGRAGIQAAGWWLILSTINLHLLAASFARTLLLERGVSNTRRRLVVLLLVAGAVTGTLLWVRAAVPFPTAETWFDTAAVRDYFQQLCASGPVYVLLAPFRWVLGPYVAPNFMAFLAALPAAVVVMALHYVWVIKSDVAFEEASAEASRQLAEKVAAVRAGNWQAAQDKPKARRAPFTLKPQGSPIVALVWKNLISVGQVVSMRLVLILVVVGVGVSLGLGRATHGRSLLLVGGFLCAMFALWALLLGPQLLRQDFRQDLAMAEWLKLMPLPGWQIAFGQILAPALILWGIQSLLLLLAAGLLLEVPRVAWLGGAANFVFAAALILLLPFLNLLLLLIPNGTVLLFPAWTLSGKDSPQGIEVMGQRIIALLAQTVVFLAALIPVGLVFALAFFLAQMAVGHLAAVLVGAAAAALVLGVEAALGIYLLGLLFDRFDPAAELGS